MIRFILALIFMILIVVAILLRPEKVENIPIEKLQQPDTLEPETYDCENCKG